MSKYTILSLAFLCWTALANSIVADEAKVSKYRLSLAVARKVNCDNKDKYLTEFGDANGPYMEAGSVTFNSSGLENMKCPVGNHIHSSFPGISDPNILYHVEFFVNEKSNGFVVVHQRPAKDAEGKELKPKEKKERGRRSYEHVELSKAAEMAVGTGNIALLKCLLQAGLQIDVPLDLETGWTALHCTAVHNKPKVAKMLIENGASLESRGKYGQRPIDYAFEDNAEELCNVLKKPEKKERMCGGFPEALLDEVFFPLPEKDDKVMFLSVNGKDANDSLMKYFRTYWPNVRHASRGEEVERGKTSYRDKKTKDYGYIVQISITPNGEKSFNWSHREASGPSMAGGGQDGKISKKFGYWLNHDTGSWDE